jgi:hypothetical protein
MCSLNRISGPALGQHHFQPFGAGHHWLVSQAALQFKGEVLQALPGTLWRCTLFKTSRPAVVGTLSTAETQYNTTSMEGLMGLLSGFNVTLLEIEMLGQAARAAFSGAAIPKDWSVLTPEELGVAPQYWDGDYFSNNGASAIVLQQGNAIVVAFRGTDSQEDFAYYPELLSGTYIDRFQPLLTAIAAPALADKHFYFTGASLGGGAVNQMADIASYQYAGRFAAAQFVAFASPTIANANGILNVGFENDPIYKVLENYSDQPSSLDNLVLATAEYMAGNYDGWHPPSDYAHTSAFDVIGRLKDSAFYDFMSPDSVLIFDAYSGPVTDVTPGRSASDREIDRRAEQGETTCHS